MSAALLAALLADARSALADDWATPLAVDLFNEGKEAESRGDYATACSKFAESANVEAKVGTLARLAQCEERRGLTLSARTHWEQASELARSLNDPRADHARQEFARIDAQVPKLKLVLAGSAPVGLAVTVDDHEISLAALGTELPVTAGEHRVRADALGKRPFTASVPTAADGAVTTVAIELYDAIATGVTAPPPPSPLPSDTAPAPVAPSAMNAPGVDRPGDAPAHRWTAQKTLAITSAGLGVVAASIGSYFGLRSFAKWSEAKSDCSHGCGPNDPGTASRKAAVDAATASDIAFGSAAFLLGGGVALWLTAKPEPTAQARSVRVVLLAGPVVGMAVTGWFGR